MPPVEHACLNRWGRLEKPHPYVQGIDCLLRQSLWSCFTLQPTTPTSACLCPDFSHARDLSCAYQCAQLSARLRDAEAKCASLNRELAAANEQRVAAAKEAAEASASAVETTQELDAAQARIEVLENQLEALRAQLSETELKATALHRQAHRHGLSRSSSTGGGLEVAPVAAPGDKEGEGKEARLLLQARVGRFLLFQGSLCLYMLCARVAYTIII